MPRRPPRSFESRHDRASTLPDFDENARLTLKQRLAFCYIRLGDGAKAERLFRELIAAFTRVNGPDSPNVLRVRLNLAQAFMIQGKHKEAVAGNHRHLSRSIVARLGEDHELSMQVLSTRAESEGSLELWNDAIRDDLKIHELAVRKQGPLSFFAIATLSDAALAQCRSGNYREGEANARQSYLAFGQGIRPARRTDRRTRGHAGSLPDRLGKLDEASGLLQNIDAKAVAQLAGVPDWSAHLELSQAEIAYKRGDYESARKHLLKAAPAFSRAGAEPYQKRTFETLSANLGKQLARK